MDSGLSWGGKGRAQFIWCMRPRYEMFGQLEMGRTGREMDCKKFDNIYQWLVLWLVGGSHRKALMRRFQRMGTCVVYNPPLKRKTWYVEQYGMNYLACWSNRGKVVYHNNHP